MYCPQTTNMHPQAMQKVFTQHYYSSTAHSRNRRATSTGNCIRITIPGLKNETEIPFPDRKLPVCFRCKKIYKTRELCRVRDRHTEVPWSTTYICVTLDDSCFTRNNNGEMRLVEEGPFRFVARSVTGPPAAYRSKGDTLGGTKAPICMACKDKNYTRHHCRVKNKHLELPWGTVYVMMSAVRSGSNNTGSPPAGFNNDNDSVSESAGSKRSLKSSDSADGSEPSTKRSRSSSASVGGDPTDDAEETSDKDPSVEDITHVQSSKAFLLTVGKDLLALNWLDLDLSAPQRNGEGSPSWNEPPMDNMYQGPPPPPHGWSGFNNNFMPHAPPSYSHPASVNPMSSMNGGRSSPHEYGNQGGYGNYSISSYGSSDHSYSSGPMGKPNMPPQNNGNYNHGYNNHGNGNNSYPSYEDRENQGPMMNHQGPPPGPPMGNYPPSKPFQQSHGPQSDGGVSGGPSGPGGSSGPGGMMNRSSPVPPSGDYMNGGNQGNQNMSMSSQGPYSQQYPQHYQQHPHQQQRGPDPGFNAYNDYNRRDRYSGPPGPPYGGMNGGPSVPPQGNMNGPSGPPAPPGPHQGNMNGPSVPPMNGGPSGPPQGNRGNYGGGNSNGNGMPFYPPQHPSGPHR